MFRCVHPLQGALPWIYDRVAVRLARIDCRGVAAYILRTVAFCSRLVRVWLATVVAEIQFRVSPLVILWGVVGNVGWGSSL